MKRFRWLKQGSRAAFVSSAATKMVIYGIELEEAVARTFEQGRHTVNGEAMAQRELRAVKREVLGLYQQAVFKARKR